MVAADANKITLGQGLFFILSAKVWLHTNIAVHPTSYTAVAVPLCNLHGITRLHFLLSNVHTFPVGAGVNVGIAQINRCTRSAFVLVNLTCLQAATCYRAAHNHHPIVCAQGGRAFIATVVPHLTLATGAAGLPSRVCGFVHGSSIKAQILPIHGKQIICGRRSRHNGIAVGGAQVNTARCCQHITVDAVERNRQANRHRNTVAGTRQRR